MDGILNCKHEKCRPVFDEEAAKGLSSAEVRKRWPRFVGNCPDCGEPLISYASTKHYAAGDY